MLTEAEEVIHARTALACEAAAGLPGTFSAWREDGLLAVLATAPELSFLRTISGVTEENLPSALRLAVASCWDGAPPTLVLPPGLNPPGLVPDGVRPIAILPLTDLTPTGSHIDDSPGIDVFLRILLDGYESGGAVTEFIAAEHRDPRIRRSLLVEDGVPISAAAMSSHGPGVLLGGSATPREHRGRGAQARLMAHGLAEAAREGHRFAVATAVEGSPSLSNLRRAGARVHLRQAFRLG
ncbi:GNAT family N-acetyltransferase [Amycolatopsis azurea]|uniref:N-acetyltransferase domain-containing protein n=1 Tax=Amycolatopsis azurea DSM 43854 TaxID=1238180 RepID=M2Q9D6_9PSEU|nr:hypothetical protein [Amycolatopsis azurea]EMD28585.1 hypothetical protein C791_0666 [Amycolatopsis azurea DSM 43854]OOC02248.1 hypothetical protein B0293_32945 [Amycolatopsis azurea DSM 43854]